MATKTETIGSQTAKRICFRTNTLELIVCYSVHPQDRLGAAYDAAHGSRAAVHPRSTPHPYPHGVDHRPGASHPRPPPSEHAKHPRGPVRDPASAPALHPPPRLERPSTPQGGLHPARRAQPRPAPTHKQELDTQRAAAQHPPARLPHAKQGGGHRVAADHHPRLPRPRQNSSPRCAADPDLAPHLPPPLRQSPPYSSAAAHHPAARQPFAHRDADEHPPQGPRMHAHPGTSATEHTALHQSRAHRGATGEYTAKTRGPVPVARHPAAAPHPMRGPHDTAHAQPAHMPRNASARLPHAVPGSVGRQLLSPRPAPRRTLSYGMGTTMGSLMYWWCCIPSCISDFLWLLSLLL